MRRQAEAQAEALARQKAEERAFKQKEMLQYADYLQDIQMEKLRQAGKIKNGEAEKVSSEVQKQIDRLGEIQTDLGGKFADDMYKAWQEGNLGTIYQIMLNVGAHPELAYGLTGTTVTGEGEEQKAQKKYGALKDAGILRDVARRLIALGPQLGYKMGAAPTEPSETSAMVEDVRKRLNEMRFMEPEAAKAAMEALIAEGVNPNLIKQIIGEIQRATFGPPVPRQ
jgi:hypothetical protein